MRVRPLFEVQKAPVCTPVSTKGTLQPWKPEVCLACKAVWECLCLHCPCTLPVMPGESSRTHIPAAMNLPCVLGHAQAGTNLHLTQACCEDTFPYSSFKSHMGSILMFLSPQPEFYQGWMCLVPWEVKQMVRR